MDVKYIPSDWKQMKSSIGDLIGLGRWGKGMIDDLKDISRNFQDARSDIKRYDSDGVVHFSHIDQEKSYQKLFEDLKVMHNFTGKVGDIVERTIDQPFYEDIDAFVEAMQQATISNYTTKNRLGIEEEKKYHVQGMTYTTREVKAEVSLDDLLAGDNFYATQMKIEYDMWKAEHPDQDFSYEEYRMAAVNMNAFEYTSIKDQQINKEFWVNIAIAVVIIGVTVVCPPAGLTLGIAYGTLELKSAVTGEDWLTGRELDTGERWMRGLLAPLDIVPGVSGIKKFSTGVRLGNQALDLGHMAMKPGIRQTFKREIVHVKDMINTAGALTAQRVRSASSAFKDAMRVAREKVAKDLQDIGRIADSAVTSAKNIIPPRNVMAIDGVGGVKMPAENTHFFENKAKALFSKVDDVSGGGSPKLKFDNARDFFNHINEIGRRTDLSPEQKLKKIHEAYANLNPKGDITVPADVKYLKSDAFVDGRPNYDWPDKLGFDEKTIQPINRDNPLPEKWDRVGGKGGENFTTLPDNRPPYTYDERAIPYLENPEARHVGTFNNEIYFDAIDAISKGDLDELNRILVSNGKKPFSQVQFDDIIQEYNDFQKRVKDIIGNIDAKYGLKGFAAPWLNDSRQILMEGGAEQVVTPLSAKILEQLGVIPKY